MRFLNGFILIGIILLFISVAGLVKGNTLLTEPGQQPNPFAWLEYLAAAVLMLINGAVSIWSYRQHDDRRTPPAPEVGGVTPGDSPAVSDDAGEFEPTVTTVLDTATIPDKS